MFLNTFIINVEFQVMAYSYPTFVYYTYCSAFIVSSSLLFLRISSLLFILCIPWFYSECRSPLFSHPPPEISFRNFYFLFELFPELTWVVCDLMTATLLRFSLFGGRAQHIMVI